MLIVILKNTQKGMIIANSQDIKLDIREGMQGLPDPCLPMTHFQLVYSGNGPSVGPD